jgi:hypothetical protein
LLEYFRERSSGQTDTMIEEYADTTEVDRYAPALQMVQHVDRISSRDNDATTTRAHGLFGLRRIAPKYSRRSTTHILRRLIGVDGQTVALIRAGTRDTK